MEEMHQIIEQCRQNIGPTPRAITPRERCDYFAMTLPQWLRNKPDDGIWQIYHAKDTLIMMGTVVWGHMVQANELLFSPGKQDCPAMAVYCTDPAIDNDLPALQRIAHELFSLKGTKQTDPELARFAAVITNEMDRSMRVDIPTQITGGREVSTTCIMVHRHQLPNRVLSNSYFPLLVCPEITPCTIMLPYQYWPETLKKIWIGEIKEPFLQA